MRKCYFCGATKGLKAVFIEDCDGFHTDKSCCGPCFNNPDNNMESDHSTDPVSWEALNYHWKPKQLRVNRQKMGQVFCLACKGKTFEIETAVNPPEMCISCTRCVWKMIVPLK